MPTVDRDRVHARMTGLVVAAAAGAPRANSAMFLTGLTALEVEAVAVGLAAWAAHAGEGPSIGKRPGDTDESLHLEDLAAMFPRGRFAGDIDAALDRYDV